MGQISCIYSGPDIMSSRFKLPGGGQIIKMPPCCSSVAVDRRLRWSCVALVVVSAFFWGWAVYNMVGPKKMGFDGGVICTSTCLASSVSNWWT